MEITVTFALNTGAWHLYQRQPVLETLNCSLCLTTRERCNLRCIDNGQRLSSEAMEQEERSSDRRRRSRRTRRRLIRVGQTHQGPTIMSETCVDVRRPPRDCQLRAVAISRKNYMYQHSLFQLSVVALSFAGVTCDSTHLILHQVGRTLERKRRI